MEVAARRRIDGAGHVALEDDPLAGLFGHGLGHGAQERLRVRVQRAGENLLRRAHFDDAAQVHHGHAPADMTDDAEVVGDEEVREIETLLQVLQQVDNLRLNRDIERGNRLVADDDLGADRQGAGDADALALAAAELVREALGVVGVQADGLEQLGHAVAPGLALGQAVDRQRLADDRADRHARIERGIRVLEDHLDLAPVGEEPAVAERREVGRIAVVHFAGGGPEELDDGPAERRFAAAALADQAERFAAVQVETDVIDGPHVVDRARQQSLFQGEVFAKVAHSEEGAVWGLGLPGQCGSPYRQRIKNVERTQPGGSGTGAGSSGP